ncbi:uncharacterized protein [Euphorbia lathyris]|uniref:uncharacterized protein n=1 Tax=Euphorbia lathyris TaxID=212925 RepID=UPI003313185F
MMIVGYGYDKVSKKLKGFNEYLLEGKDPVHAWSVICIVFVLAFSGFVILFNFLQTKLLGRVPTAHELFAFTHTKRHDGTSWSDPRAQVVAEEYVRAVALSAQSERDRVIDLLKTYYDVVGGHSKKQRLYGLGDAACRYFGSATSQCSSTPNTPGASTSSSSSDPHSHLQSQLDMLHKIVQTLADSQQRHGEGVQEEDHGSRQLHIGVTPKMIENVMKKQNDMEVQMREQLGSLQNVIVRFELEMAEIRESQAQHSSSNPGRSIDRDELHENDLT